MSRGRLLPLGLLLLAFALRLFRLGDQNVWWDEGLAIWAVRKSFIDTTLWTAGDVHPPLFVWTLWPWVRLVGQTEFAARLITVVWGMLSAALAYALGRRLGGGRYVRGVTVLAPCGRLRVLPVRAEVVARGDEERACVTRGRGDRYPAKPWRAVRA